MTSEAADRRLLLVHAHPDDESINHGATMARHIASGGHVTLVTCTLGELGEVLVPELANLAADHADQLGGYRIGELAAAMRELGVTDHRFLGAPGRWRDSGMMGTDGNADPRSFWHCDSDEKAFATAVGHLVEVIREVRPQVLATYDEIGGYGHPDHIMAHRVAMAAADAAGDPAAYPELGAAWTISKVYWAAFPKSMLQAGIDAMVAAGMEPMFGATDANDLPMGNPDSEVTTAVEARAFVKQKLAALAAHATQITPDWPLFALSRLLGDDALGVEYYRIVRGELAGELDADGRETDLFAGTAT